MVRSANRLVSTTHILKAAVAGFETQNINERLRLAAAWELGLPAANTQIETFADALAINWLIAGTDAHAKNYNLLLAVN